MEEIWRDFGAAASVRRSQRIKSDAVRMEEDKSGGMEGGEKES